MASGGTTKMAEQCNSKGWTRADVLVAGIACLMLILLVPVLFARPREQAARRVCMANLARIGKAMLAYAGDNDEELPRAGGHSTPGGFLPVSGWRTSKRRAPAGF